MNTHDEKTKKIRDKKRKRLKTNTNIRLVHEPRYLGFDLIPNIGPFSENYLIRTLNTIRKALDEHPRVFAVRFDLRFPKDFPHNSKHYDTSIISTFIDSLKDNIKRARTVAEKQHKRVHNTRVRYIWAMENKEGEHPHYHIVLLLNYDAYNSIGSCSSKEMNLCKRVNEAWNKALGLVENNNYGLVEIPKFPLYYVYRGDDASISRLYHRASYLCKVDTKDYGDGKHRFDCSRK